MKNKKSPKLTMKITCTLTSVLKQDLIECFITRHSHGPNIRKLNNQFIKDDIAALRAIRAIQKTLPLI